MLRLLLFLHVTEHGYMWLVLEGSKWHSMVWLSALVESGHQATRHKDDETRVRVRVDHLEFLGPT